MTPDFAGVAGTYKKGAESGPAAFGPMPEWAKGVAGILSSSIDLILRVIRRDYFQGTGRQSSS